MAANARRPTSPPPDRAIGDPPSAVDVVVRVGGVDLLAGRLYSHMVRGVESSTFTYDESWLADRRGYALEPALPLVSGPQHTAAGQAMFRAFADSAPDRWGRRMVERAERLRAEQVGSPARRLSEMTFLLGVRDDLRQGAVRFRDPASGAYLADDITGVPAVTELPRLLGLAGKVERDEAHWDELRVMLRAGSSLGGARPKAHVLAPDGNVAMAKFPSSNNDTWNVMAWEKTALDLARLAGIAVPASTLLTVAGRQVLVIDRFDRAGNAGARIGYVSALTLLEARDGDTASYLDIAAVIEEVSPSAAADLQQLWRRAAFGVLISNTDNHLRNHGFVHTGAQAWALSPAFDMNPDPGPEPKYFATAIADPADTQSSITELLTVAPHFRLSATSAAEVLGEVATAVAQWRHIAARNGLTDKEAHLMRPAFEHQQAAAAREHLAATT